MSADPAALTVPPSCLELIPGASPEQLPQKARLTRRETAERRAGERG
jgi:hypothetical protein